MTCLILINGAPASGKSTLARRYADEHPLTLALDIDVVRGLLGSWLTDSSSAGLLARKMAIEMARTALADGHDVVVPQLLGQPRFVHELDALAAEAGVPFAETVLIIPPGEEERRFVQRSGGSRRADADNARLQDRHGGLATLTHAATAIQRVVAERPGTHTIITHQGAVEAAYAELLAFVRSVAGSSAPGA
ncbi:MAG: AAA family ATPase [Mycobacteriales bacterium]